MTIETFTWCPRINPEQEVSFRTRHAQFGDGYAQVSGDGLNPRSQKWTLEFTGNETYITAIKAFLDRHGGVKAFQWTPPLNRWAYTVVQAISPCRWATKNITFP
jgi:phage-related protein